MQVSVIIPVYNVARYVAEAVDSALSQPQTGQVILVEDGSTDDSLRVCRALAGRHRQVELHRHPDGANRGVSASRNLGIEAARCAYTAFLDADDWYSPNRFEIAERTFAANPTADGVYDAVGILCEDETVVHWYRCRGEPDLIGLKERVEPERLFEALVGSDLGYFCTDGVVVRTRFLRRTGGFDPSLAMGEDTAMWVRMSVLGRLVAGSLDRPVAMRRIHDRNTIYTGRRSAGPYALQMAESLYTWSGQIGLSRRRRIMLLNWILNFSIDPDARRTGYLVRKAAELGYFASFAARFPLALQSRHFWRMASASMGVKRLAGVFRPGRRSSAGIDDSDQCNTGEKATA